MSQPPNEDEEVTLTKENIFLDGKSITKARRALIENPTTDEDVQAFADHYDALKENENKSSLNSWYENGTAVGVFEEFPNCCSTRMQVIGSNEFVHDYIYHRPSTPPPRNEFKQGTKLETDIVEQIVRAVYISDWKGIRPKCKLPRGNHRKYYDVRWANLYVKFENIQYLPKNTELLTFERFENYFRENHYDIYCRIHNLPLPIKTTEQNLVQHALPSTSGLQSSSTSANMEMNNSSGFLPNSTAQSQQQLLPQMSKQRQMLLEGRLQNPQQQPGSSTEVEVEDNSKADNPLTKGQKSNETVQNNLNKSAEVVVPADPRLAKNFVHRAKEAVKQELANYPALAITVLHFKDKPKDQTTFLAILAHFIPKSSTNYQVKTRVLSFGQIPDNNDEATRIKFDDTIKHFALDQKYLVIVSREHLRKALTTESKYQWLQCHDEWFESLVDMEITPNGKSISIGLLIPFSNQDNLSEPINTSPDELGSKASSLLARSEDFVSYQIGMTECLAKIKKLANVEEDCVPQCVLLDIWFIIRGFFKGLQKPWSENMVKVCSEKMKSFEPIQQTAFFLSPWNFRNWNSSRVSGVDVFTDADAENITNELEKFAKLFPDISKIKDSDDFDDDDPSLARSIKRQKRLHEEMELLIPKDTENIQPEKLDTKQIIEKELNGYRNSIELKILRKNFSLSAFWESKSYSLPFLKEAAHFYLSLPATTISSGKLLRNAFAQARRTQNSKAIIDNVIAIINEKLWDIPQQPGSSKTINQSVESAGKDVTKGNLQADKNNETDKIKN